MTRLSIELPATALFVSQYRVREADINQANHLAAVSVLPIAINAQSALLEAIALDPDNSEVGLIMASSQIDYISESYLDDLLDIDVYYEAVNSKSFNLLYCLRAANTQHEVARVQTRMLFFDFVLRKVAVIPEEFSSAVKTLGLSRGINCTALLEKRGEAVV